MIDPALTAGPWWILILMVVGALATYFWRALGVALSGRINTESRLFEWVACIAYAMLAGLISRMILLPNGPLAETATADRIAGGAGALVLFSWGRAFF